jgi:hypothetical protein
MSTKLNTNLNAVELTQDELNSVTGGNTKSSNNPSTGGNTGINQAVLANQANLSGSTAAQAALAARLNTSVSAIQNVLKNLSGR